MIDPIPSTDPAPAPPTEPAFETLSTVFRFPECWTILSALADGSSLLKNEIADRTTLSMEDVTKHLKRLRDTGLVIAPRGKLYEIDPRLLADKANRVVDFGCCTLGFKESLPND
jgi:biotin operon repressor